MTNKTADVARIAVMGPDSRILLRSLEISDDQLQNSGSHLEIDIIMEPVRVCHSDFAGPHGYDFIIPIEPYNMILAVICDWGVRLGMNLIPAGWAALQETARKHRKFEFNLKHLNNKTKCILPVSETS